MQKIIANIVGKARRELLHGREHLVAPMSMIVPGVLNGTHGPLLYTQEEIGKNVQAWNGMPIVDDHPTFNGQPVSARTPAILNTKAIGVVLNATANGKLTAEGWFDIEATKRINNEILMLLEEGKPFELSTGLELDMVQPSEINPTFNGEEYTGIAINLKPDHLAVFTGNQIGACSKEDGCGVLINKEDAENFGKALIERVKGKLDEDEMKELKKLLNSKLSKTSNAKESEMELNEKQREEVINILVDNCGCSSNQEDKDVFNKLSDESLVKLKDKLVKNALHDPEEDAKKAAEKKKMEEEEAANKKKKEAENKDNKKTDNVQTPEEWLSNAPAAVQSIVNRAIAQEETEKTKLIKVIVGNVNNTFTEEGLKLKGVSELEAIAKIAAPAEVANVVAATPLYLGVAGGPVVTNLSDDDENDVLPLPTYNWGKEKKA